MCNIELLFQWLCEADLLIHGLTVWQKTDYYHKHDKKIDLLIILVLEDPAQ